ncbi:MAG: tetraacyldisaccharide 4'-kinase [Methylococcaceae bacterium]|jgi:tetraacyldisaccharide 4'-kinase
MKKTLSRWLQDVWYKDPFIGTWLMPLGFLFSDIVRFRRFCYRIGIKKIHKLPIPVVIVGNITVGGTGKTPLVIYLAQLLITAGYKPGIITRGYGGKSDTWPVLVNPETDVLIAGDEALLLAKHTQCPVAVGPNRVLSAQLLLKQAGCNLILSDDGLQHYALARDVEIAVIDGERRFGNGYCLPAGPLREPLNRLQDVDMVVVNGGQTEQTEFAMQLLGNQAVNLKTREQKALTDFAVGGCHAVAGIGNPGRFFNLLSNAGITATMHSFPDHYPFEHSDIDFHDGLPVLMTEKDAVKCAGFASLQHWYVPVQAILESNFKQQFITLLRDKTNG